jgi:hypothetical protein
MKVSQSLFVVAAAAAGTALAFSPQQQSTKNDVANSSTSNRRNFLSTGIVGAASACFLPKESNAFEVGGKLVLGDESIMAPKAHGTSSAPVQENLLYGVSNQLADKICNFNRHFAERGGYFLTTSFEDEVLAAKGPITFYDSVSS